MNIWYSAYTGFLIDTTIRATLLLVLAGTIVLLARRASASFRHLVWALSLGCILLLPVLLWNGPHWRVPLITAPTHTQSAKEVSPPAHVAPRAATAGVADRATASQAISHKAGVPATAAVSPAPTHPQQYAQPPATALDTDSRPAVPPTPKITWYMVILYMWAAGAALVLLRVALGFVSARRLAKYNLPITDGPIADAALAAADATEVGRRCRVRVAAAVGQVTVPITFRALHPTIVLPADAQDWPSERLRAALLHEMAHVKRSDWTVQMCAYLVCALYWFHPLAWVALARMRAESEAACDDLALAAGMPAQDYARHLLDIALAVRDTKRLRMGTMAMAQGPKVECRLRSILAQQRSRRPLTWRSVLSGLAVGVLLVAPVAAFQLVRQRPSVPGVARLQLHGNFTLRYAVTITDMEITQAKFQEYQQLRSDFMAILKQRPDLGLAPPGYYAPFSYFQERRPRLRHLILTVSEQNGHLLLRSEEAGDTFAELYNGRTGTQLFHNGHAGFTSPGLNFEW